MTEMKLKNVGQHEGPHLTSTAVDLMKRFACNILDFLSLWSAHFQKMADCEVEGTIVKLPLASPLERAMSRTGKGETKEGTSELDRIRWDRKRADAHQQSSNNS
ncbi:hypothetical protein TNCV_58561 [Trichonephila clavipes]|nr:hypothetical protein TNCV_58561 [Trichonephila clavipes]